MYLVSEELKKICDRIGINFVFAVMEESSQELSMNQATEMACKAYPAIVCTSNITEDSDKDFRHKFKFDLKGYIIVLTDPGLTTIQRVEQIYKPTLNPLYDKFVKQVKRSNKITAYYNFKSTQKNIYYLRHEEANQNQLNEVVDAISFEIKDLFRISDKKILGKTV